jgi:hypothetical protein
VAEAVAPEGPCLEWTERRLNASGIVRSDAESPGSADSTPTRFRQFTPGSLDPPALRRAVEDERRVEPPRLRPALNDRPQRAGERQLAPPGGLCGPRWKAEAHISRSNASQVSIAISPFRNSVQKPPSMKSARSA